MEKDFNTGLRRSLESDRIKLTRRRKQLLREMGYSEDLDSAELAEKLHEQVRANDVLNRSITRQEEEIKKLKARIVELETGHRPIVKTSANSSVPPSKNPIGVPHTQSQRKPSVRKHLLTLSAWTLRPSPVSEQTSYCRLSLKSGLT